MTAYVCLLCGQEVDDYSFPCECGKEYYVEIEPGLGKRVFALKKSLLEKKRYSELQTLLKGFRPYWATSL